MSEKIFKNQHYRAQMPVASWSDMCAFLGRTVIIPSMVLVDPLFTSLLLLSFIVDGFLTIHAAPHAAAGVVA